MLYFLAIGALASIPAFKHFLDTGFPFNFQGCSGIAP